VIDAWVVNASPIITLAKAGHLELIEEPGIDVLVPDAVSTEVLSGSISDPARIFSSVLISCISTLALFQLVCISRWL